MQVKDFDARARYDHWIVKEVDDRGELIHIRFVEYGGLKTAELLKKNGYVQVFSGCQADGYELPGYRKILVWKSLSSEAAAGTIVATRTKDVFDAEGKKLGQIWDTKHCGVGGCDYDLIGRCNEWTWSFVKLVYLHEKYIEFFEKLKELNYKNRGYLTKMTYQEVRDIVDSGKAEEFLKKAEAKRK